MRWVLFFLASLGQWGIVLSQVTGDMQQLDIEQLALKTEAEEIEDDGQSLDWEYLMHHKLDINHLSPDQLQHLLKVSPALVKQFVRYREIFGPFLHLMELQSIPGWNTELIRTLLPFLTINAAVPVAPLIGERIKKGEHLLLLRFGGQRSLGLNDVARLQSPQNFVGSPLKMMFRYAFRYGNYLQWGISMEKDAGESMFPGGFFKGPDFTSVHLSVRNLGMIKTFVLGDFHVNLGQGLIHWQSMAFGKSSSSMMVLRQGERLRAYTGTDENRFHRGFGIELARGDKGFLFFAAIDRMDGNLKTAQGDSSRKEITALQWSGLHRNDAEQMDRNALRQHVLGSAVYIQRSGWKLAWNGIAHFFKTPIQAGSEPYKLFYPSGKQWFNHSIDFGAVLRNFYVFGEWAQSSNGGFGFLQGLLVSLDTRLDMALLFRHLTTHFGGFQQNFFAEYGSGSNETGIYLGLQFRPKPAWIIDGSMDFWKSPWVRYRVSGPSMGREISIQVTWKPSKMLEIRQRFQSVEKPLNTSINVPGVDFVANTRRNQYRFRISFQPNRSFMIRQQVDFLAMKTNDKQLAWAQFLEGIWTATKSRISLSTRVLWFSAEDYEARLYQYERDILYYNGISMLHRSGFRFYMVVETELFAGIFAQFKFFNTQYTDNHGFAINNPKLLEMGRIGIHAQFIKRL